MDRVRCSVLTQLREKSPVMSILTSQGFLFPIAVSVLFCVFSRSPAAMEFQIKESEGN